MRRFVRSVSGVVAAVVLAASVAPAVGADRAVTTGYTETEATDVLSAAAYLGMDPGTLQVFGVQAARFVLELVRRPSDPVVGRSVPGSTGPFEVASMYRTGEQEDALRFLEGFYAIGPVQAQRVGATFVSFLAGLDAARKGVPYPVVPPPRPTSTTAPPPPTTAGATTTTTTTTTTTVTATTTTVPPELPVFTAGLVQAEDTALRGELVVSPSGSGSTGSGSLGFWGTPGDRAAFLLDGAGGEVVLSFRYRLRFDAAPSDREVLVDGRRVATVRFAGTTADWHRDAWSTEHRTVTVPGGRAEVAIVHPDGAAHQWLDLDSITITPVAQVCAVTAATWRPATGPDGTDVGRVEVAFTGTSCQDVVWDACPAATVSLDERGDRVPTTDPVGRSPVYAWYRTCTRTSAA